MVARGRGVPLVAGDGLLRWPRPWPRRPAGLRRSSGRLLSQEREDTGLQEREALAREELEARRTSAAREVDRRADLERSGLRGDFFGSGGSR